MGGVSDKMKKLTIFLIVGIILVATLVVAQSISFPPTFRMNLNQLPIRQSAEQIIFNCQYDENIEHRETEIISYNETSRLVIADIKYWTNGRKCAGSKRLNFTMPVSGNQGQLVINFVNEVNTRFIIEAERNNRRLNRTVVSRGGNV